MNLLIVCLHFYMTVYTVQTSCVGNTAYAGHSTARLHVLRMSSSRRLTWMQCSISLDSSSELVILLLRSWSCSLFFPLSPFNYFISVAVFVVCSTWIKSDGHFSLSENRLLRLTAHFYSSMVHISAEDIPSDFFDIKNQFQVFFRVNGTLKSISLQLFFFFKLILCFGEAKNGVKSNALASYSIRWQSEAIRETKRDHYKMSVCFTALFVADIQ